MSDIAEYGIAGIAFKMELPVKYGPGGKADKTFAFDDMLLFEQEIARWIVSHGHRTPGVIGGR